MTKTLNEWKEFAAKKPFTSRDIVFDILNAWEEDSKIFRQEVEEDRFCSCGKKLRKNETDKCYMCYNPR